MELLGFRIQNYRSVNDSGWIDVEPLTVLVGKNQSGKSALLRGLQKFNPFKDEPYNMDREWPRGHRKDRDKKAPVVTVRFEFTELEEKELSEIAGKKIPKTIEITKGYDGQKVFSYREEFNPDERVEQEMVDKIKELTGLAIESSEKFHLGMEKYQKELNEFVNRHEFVKFVECLRAANQKLASSVSTQEPAATKDREILPKITANATTIAEKCPQKSIRSAIEIEIAKRLPVFVYMDEFRQYSGATFLNQLKERRDRNQMTPEDETVLILMKMAGIDLDDQIAKVGAENREQRALDLNDASITLTKEMAGRWSQEQYVVQFTADQYHMMTFVRSPQQTALVPLEEESKGFQWFFSFDIHFAYETRGALKGAIILLDEPGLHLHPKAQEDLLKRLEAYCKGNQLIFSTHLPFMIDLNKPERIRIVERGDEGTVVSDDIFGGEGDARFSLMAKLGMSASQSLLVAKFNLVVEGTDDYWYITAISELLKRSGKDGIDDRIQITAAGGASEAAYMATFMCGQDLNVSVLFDSDKAGERSEEALIKKWLAKYRSKQITILKIGEMFTKPRTEASMEDMLTEEYYIPFVQTAYRKELNGQILDIKSRNEPQLVKRIELELKTKGIEAFNKGRVGKLIRDDIRNKQVKDMPKETIDNFEHLFEKLRAIAKKWQVTS